MQRREFLKATAALSFATILPGTARSEVVFAPHPGAWRSVDLVTRIEIDRPAGKMQAWIPLPSVNETAWMRPGESTWTGNAASVTRVRDAKYGAEMLHAIWKDGESAPAIEVVSRVAMRDRDIDLGKPGNAASLSDAERKLNLEGTELIPVDGIVKQTSDKIIAAANAKTDLEKARAIYEWVVENTVRVASTRGCGIGDVAAMLKSGNLGGKCADLNALYVGLTRAAGVPARDVYGIRVIPSQFGYKSLGAGSANVTKAQHCRAEVFLAGFGWVPVDPADVRKVMLEEPPKDLPINDPKVVAARKALFGAWEGNWVAYNTAHDVALPGSTHPKLGFLMYPQAERASLLLDCLDPDKFRYTLTVKEVKAS
ncbi:transglutaminase-like domain-containing protein [[Pseudomonas] carboxydohydrogena]|uniref:transglutaminase-like domain-containing protein n=1 Tax=Afipia carboxydohydrogena TaxID=290 RepID=UPI0023B15579|nr:transglutaminase domain-containing protein [[Pseudomonas] carboxydohydrogena]